MIRAALSRMRAMTAASRSKVLLAVLGAVVGLGIVGAGVAFGYWMTVDSSNPAQALAASLSAPTTPIATANSSGAITVGWTLPASQLPGAQYQVERTIGPGSPTTVCTVASTVTSCQDTGLTAGTTYSYSIMAILGLHWQSTAITTSATTLAVITTSLPAGDANTAYSTTLAATGGSGTYTSWTQTGGILPAGLSLDGSTGVIHGTPTTLGTATGLVFKVTDSNGATASSTSLSLVINAAPSVTTTSLATATDGQTGYSQTLAESGGTSPFTWSISSGSLPSGLSLSSGGVISGTVGGSATSQTFTVKVTDSNSVAATKSLSITVNAAPSVTTTTATLANATAGAATSAYSTTLTATGGTGTLTWSATSLPTWLTLTAAGVLSNNTTVPAAGSYGPFTVTVTDTNNVQGSASLSITVNAAPSVTTTSLATATDGQTGYSQTLAESGGTSPFTWSISSGSLPSGLSLSSGGVISGTVGGSATSQTFTVKVTDSNSVAATKSLSITVNAAPSVTTTTATLANATAGAATSAYSTTLTATGGTGTLTWSATSLPTWLTLTAAGVLSNNTTVPAAGSYGPFTVKVTDTNNVASSGKSLTITVNAAPSVTTTSLATATDGQTGYSQTLAESGGTSPFTWSISSGSLPSGLSLSSGGVISGTVGGSATSQTFTVKVTDSNSVAATKSLSITVNAAPSVTTTTATLANATAGAATSAYSTTLTATGGTGTLTWSATSLPTWLTLTAAGVLSNNTTVPAAGSYGPFTVTVTDTNNVQGSASLSITVNAAPSVTTTSLATATDGQTGYSQTLAESGGTSPFTWSISSGSLPSGLSLSSGGVISGTVGGSATSQTFTVKVTDSNSVAATKSLSITVNAAPSVTTTTATLANATAGAATSAYSTTLTATGGTGTLTWSATALPAWLTLTAAGVLSNNTTVPAAGSYGPFTVKVTDTNNVQGSASLSITVNAAPSVTTTSLATATDGQTGYSQTLAESGGTSPFTWSISSGSLPSGLSLSSGGVISGTVGARRPARPSRSKSPTATVWQPRSRSALPSTPPRRSRRQLPRWQMQPPGQPRLSTRRRSQPPEGPALSHGVPRHCRPGSR